METGVDVKFPIARNKYTKTFFVMRRLPDVLSGRLKNKHCGFIRQTLKTEITLAREPQGNAFKGGAIETRWQRSSAFWLLRSVLTRACECTIKRL